MGIQFTPVRLREENLPEIINNGCIYFTIDTGKIFVDTSDSRIGMGGSGAALFYANIDENPPQLEDESYNMTYDELENQSDSPKPGDLIINTDGRFFKVITADKETNIINYIVIAVSGTGGGGEGGDTPSSPKITLEVVSDIPDTYVFGQESPISVIATAESGSQITITTTINFDQDRYPDESPLVLTRKASSGALVTFKEIGESLKLGTNKIVITARDEDENTKTVTRSRPCIQLDLKRSTNFSALSVMENDSTLIFRYVPVGAVQKTVEFYVDGKRLDNLTRILDKTQSNTDFDVEIPAQTHGIHTIKAVLSTDQGGSRAYADPIEYEVAWARTGDLTPLIWFDNYKDEIFENEKMLVNYMIYDPSTIESTGVATVNLIVNDKALPEMNIAYNNKKWETWNVTNYDVGTNVLTVGCGAVSRSISIKVEKDTVRDLNILTPGLFLNLDSKGRSNKENIISRQNWSYTNSSNETTTVKFNNFNWYNNGWTTDSDGNSCLRISNGASIEIPLSVLNVSQPAQKDALTFEFEFKIRNIQSYETLITVSTEIVNEGTDDEYVKIIKKVSSTDGVWGKYYNDALGVGFCLGTQEAFFKSTNTVVNARYKEDDIVNLTIVVEGGVQKPLMYIYLNGIASGVASPGSTDNFKADLSNFIINSEFCDIDLYKFRVYKGMALSMDKVAHNYIADKKDPEMYDANKLIKFDDKGRPKLDYLALIEYNKNNPDNQTIPYAVVEVIGDPLDRMPFVKGGKKRCNVTFTNPNLDRAYELGEIDGVKYITGCPSYTATNIEFDVQGTSSQGYPRRNYKAKFKTTEEKPATWVYTNGPIVGESFFDKVTYDGTIYKKYYMDNRSAAESTFTWKADYMESSMTHNTGFASFCQEMYDHHPLQDYIKDYSKGDHRTTVYGFPMYLFQKHTSGEYEYIGRYNYNLDKGCNAVIDFENENEHPFVSGKSIAEVAECWELTNNQDQRCSFRKVDFNETLESDDENNPDKVMPLSVLGDFEYRYNYNEDTIDEAIDLEATFPTQKEANDYLRKIYANLEKVCTWLNSTNVQDPIDEIELPEPVQFVPEGPVYTHDGRNYRLDKFRYEFTKHFNPEYCYVYYILTELLLCYDSRGKNMMLASWGPQEIDGDYIWYPIFYDIDTQLGVNNSGVPSWEYDTVATFSTPNSVLWNNLWTCFSTPIKNKYTELRNNALTQMVLDNYYDFNFKANDSYAMKGIKPINCINIDEYYKYIAPTFEGYIDTKGNVAYDNGLYFYCLQGTRELQRKLFLRSRFNYIDSEWLGFAYNPTVAKQEFKVRYNGTYFDLTSDKFIEKEPSDTSSEDWQNFLKAGGQVSPWGENPLDSTAEFTIKPFLKQFVSVIYDDKTTQPIKYDGEHPVTVPMLPDIAQSQKNGINFTQQLAYIGGVDYVSSFGDLSLMYLDEIEFAKAIRLQEFILGNETEGYMNGALKDEKFNLDASAEKDGVVNPNAKPLLEKIVLTNVGSLSSSIDVSGSEKLKEFRALGTNITDAILADGVQVEKLYLPSTINTFILNEPVALNNLLKIKPAMDEDGNFPNGLYIEGLTNIIGNITGDARTRIGTININGGNMGYDSFHLLNTLVGIKENIQNNSSIKDYDGTLKINLTGINWSPYRQVEPGEPIVDAYVYKKLTDHQTFRDYNANLVSDAQWLKDTLNGKIFQYDEAIYEANENAITSLELLDKFINSYKSEENYFKNLQEHSDNRNTLPYLSGTIFINNSVDIDETVLKNEYIDKYYPDLNIYIANVTPSHISKFVEVQNEDGLEKVWDTLKYNTSIIHPEQTKVAPYKLHYDFMGWALTPDANPEDCITNFTTLSFIDNGTDGVITFYAIYKLHAYPIRFYYGVNEKNNTPIFTDIPMEYGSNVDPGGKIPWISDKDLPLKETYGFIGYTSRVPEEFDNDPSKCYHISQKGSNLVENIADDKVLQSATYFPVFSPMSVYDNIHEEYFNFDPAYGIISWNNNYHAKGKITIPYVINGTSVKEIATRGFDGILNSNVDEITHIFWSDKNGKSDNFSDILGKGTSAFAYMNSLEYFEMPASIRTINSKCFSGCGKLYSGKYSDKTSLDYCIEEVFNNIVEIRDSAFSFTRMKDLIFGDNLQVLQSFAFEGSGDLTSLTLKPGLDMARCGTNIFSSSSPTAQVTMPRAYEPYVDSKFGLTEQTITYID